MRTTILGRHGTARRPAGRALVLASLAIGGCRVDFELPTLDVQPTIICPGDQVRVRWRKTQDGMTLAESPPVAGLDGSGATGDVSVALSVPTDFTLTSEVPGTGHVVWADRSVSLFSMVGLVTVGFCSSRTVNVSLPSMVPASVVVFQVMNTAPFPVTVTKDGVSVTVPPRGIAPFRVSATGRYDLVPQGALNCPPNPSPSQVNVPPPVPGAPWYSLELQYACPS
jgi:hypothetical protein